MMAAFNVTSLQDFGYPETTKFIDPMEERWRSKNYDDSAFTKQGIQDRLYEFYSLDAYDHVHDVEDALEAYYANGGPPKSTLVTSTRPASTVTSAATINAAVVTSSAQLSSSTKTSTKSDDKKKTTTTRVR